ncbi:MAG TPA: LemA family protein [Terriglobia bacterium]|nr:LemA family protein [Terriglobia bacterium]
MGLILLIAVFVFFGVVMLLLAFLGLRNNLVRQRNELGKAWTNFDQLLKQRRDELPRLVGTCRSFLTGSSSLFDSIAAARSVEQKAPPAEKVRAAAELTEELHKLFALADRDRELSLDTSYRHLKKQILILEERITAEQERFREQVRAYNTRLKGFSGGLAGRAAGLRPQPTSSAPRSGQS